MDWITFLCMTLILQIQVSKMFRNDISAFLEEIFTGTYFFGSAGFDQFFSKTQVPESFSHFGHDGDYDMNH